MNTIDLLVSFLTYGVFLYAVILIIFYVFIAVYSIGKTKQHILKTGFTNYNELAGSPQAPSLSIIAPAYNEGATIIENVRSLLSIYYSNFEVIVVNDGSKDDMAARMIHCRRLLVLTILSLLI
jgi:poly-beta-1,6-N-acetyl-D-glucosamine synthase